MKHRTEFLEVGGLYPFCSREASKHIRLWVIFVHFRGSAAP
jgi:hypothetical protein